MRDELARMEQKEIIGPRPFRKPTQVGEGCLCLEALAWRKQVNVLKLKWMINLCLCLSA